MSKFGSPSVTVTLDDAPGGTPRNVTNHVLTMGGAKIENITQPSHAFGDSWTEATPTGMRTVPPIQFTGLHDTAATTGPHVVFRVQDADASPSATPRVLVLGFGGGTFTVSGHLGSYEVLGKNGNLTEFAVMFTPSGAGVWS